MVHMKTVLVTGANGFIGSHLVNRLKKDNRVVSLVHSSLLGDWENESLEGTNIVDADVRNLDEVRRIVSRYEVDDIYHTAAISIVKTAFQDPVGVLSVNAMGTVSVLEAARQVGVRKILVLNTDKVYGEGLGSTEDTPYEPTEPYGASKCCQGFIVESYIRTYGMNIVMSHSCNVFGYDPFSNRIFPNVIKKCLRNESPLIFTNDDSVREYVYVEDLLDAFQILMDNDEHKGPRNISTGWIYNQKDVVLKVLEHFSLEPKYVEGEIPPQIEKQSLASVKWDWEPSHTFQESIALTIERFKSFRTDWE